jgi:hypothetical protein
LVNIPVDLVACSYVLCLLSFLVIDDEVRESSLGIQHRHQGDIAFDPSIWKPDRNGITRSGDNISRVKRELGG